MEPDYLLIGVDKHASTCMVNSIRHFIGPLKPTKNSMVKGYGGLIKVRGEGKMKWNTEYDSGQIQSMIIHKVNYVLEYLVTFYFYNSGISKPLTIIQNLMKHGDPPRPRTVSYTGTNKGTSVSYLESQVPTSDTYAPCQLPIGIVLSLQKLKRNQTVNTRNICDLTPH